MASDIVWWLVGARAVCGTLFLLVNFQTVLYASEERAIRRDAGENGMQEVVLTGEIRFAILRCIVIFLLTSSAWLSWPFVIRQAPHRGVQAVAAGLVLLIVFIDGGIGLYKLHQRRRLIKMGAIERGKMLHG